jgi:myosin heavy subunit
VSSLVAWAIERRKRRAPKLVPLDRRIQTSLKKMNEASQEMNSVIQDLVQNIQTRESGLRELTGRYKSLSKEEKALSKRVKALKEVPIAVAEYFKQISESTMQEVEKKRAKRDIVMFISGIAMTTIIAILLKIAGLG